MPEHTWVVENVDGGPAGDADVYLCTTCGCGGGPTTSLVGWFRTPKTIEEVAALPRPFFPGEGQDLSEDCAVAQQQVLFYLRGYMRAWWMRILTRFPHPKQVDRKDPEVKLFQTLSHADKYTSNTVARVEFFRLVFDADMFKGQRVAGKGVLKAKLVSMGFKLVCPDCTTCGKPTERAADDHNPLCFTCEYRQTKAKS